MTTTEQLLQNANAYAEGFDKGDLPLPPRQARRRARLHGRAPQPLRDPRAE